MGPSRPPGNRRHDGGLCSKFRASNGTKIRHGNTDCNGQCSKAHRISVASEFPTNTDTAPQAILPGTTVTFTALYTGSLGNQITLTLSAGSRANTWRLTVSLPGLQSEVYDNISGSGADFWAALAQAVNQGQGPQRGPSQLIAASAGGATMAPTAFSTVLCATAAGTDGATDVAAMTLVGLDSPPRSGMYALRGQGCGIAILADADDPDYWTTQAEFGLEEGIYMILTGPTSDTIQNAVTVKQQAGLDSWRPPKTPSRPGTDFDSLLLSEGGDLVGTAARDV